MYYPKRRHRILLNTLIAFFILAFLFIWGPWNWAGYSDQIWWFDDLGHVVYGFGAGLLVLYIKVNYTARGAFLFVGKKALLVDTVMYVMAGAAFWELAEFMWDLYLQPEFFPFFRTAQYGLRDTMFDIGNTLWAVAAALGAWLGWRLLYQMFWRDEAEEEESKEIAGVIDDARKRVTETRREHLRAARERLRRKIIGNGNNSAAQMQKPHR